MSESNLALKEKPPKFNLFSRNDPVHSFFGVKPLDVTESHHIEKLLLENFQPGAILEDQVSVDIDRMKTVTAEIKAINKQGALLIGERIATARDILKSYKDGTFVQWMDSIFESRRTAYNMLSYFDLYCVLPDHAKENFKKMPQKAAYMLASRPGNVETKVELIGSYSNLKANDMMLLIQDKLPSNRPTRISHSYHTKLIDSVFSCVNKLQKRKDELNQKQIRELAAIKELIDQIIA